MKLAQKYRAEKERRQHVYAEEMALNECAERLKTHRRNN